MTIFVALVHHPVLNKVGEVVATAVTNVDIHDVARSARTYGCRAVFIVTPVAEQQRLVGRILHHWIEGEGSGVNPHRGEAMGHLRVLPSLASAKAEIEATTGRAPIVVVTGAQLREGVLPYTELRRRITSASDPVLLVFGTGHGLAPEILGSADLRLPALERAHRDAGEPAYNHLSVRSAVAIVLDRLLGNLDE